MAPTALRMLGRATILVIWCGTCTFPVPAEARKAIMVGQPATLLSPQLPEEGNCGPPAS